MKLYRHELSATAEGSVAEWSKALVLGTSHFDGVGSNPTAAIISLLEVNVFYFTSEKLFIVKKYINLCIFSIFRLETSQDTATQSENIII